MTLTQGHISKVKDTVHTYFGSFIFVGTNFRGLNKNHTFQGLKICVHSIFLYNSYRKSLFHGYKNLWIRPSMKTTKLVPDEN